MLLLNLPLTLLFPFLSTTCFQFLQLPKIQSVFQNLLRTIMFSLNSILTIVVSNPRIQRKFCWKLYPLQRKSDVHNIFVQFKKMIELQLNTKIKQVQTDQGGEFRSLTEFFKNCGIIHRIICPHTHHQNGSIERKHRHICETGLALMAQSKLLLNFWEDAFSTTVYLINRLPSLNQNQITPLQLLFGKTPNYSFLSVTTQN